MGNKKSKGLEFLIWFLLIVNVLAFINRVNLDGISYLSTSIRPFGVLFHYIFSGLVLMQIITAIFLLRFQEWARKLFILLTVLNILFLFVKPVIDKTFFLSMDDYVRQYQSQFTPEQRINYQKLEIALAKRMHHPITNEQKERMEQMTSQIILPFYTYSLLWCLFLIFLFTRPKVKGQFESRAIHRQKI